MRRILTLVAMIALGPAAVCAQDMDLSGVLIPGEEWQLVASGYKFTEGPAVDSQGQVFFTDVPGNRIERIGLDGQVSTWLDNVQGVSGLMFGPDGRLYGCEGGKKRIVAWDSDRQPKVLADNIESNDLVVAADGTVYFTCPARKQVLAISPGGQLTTVAEGWASNGIILWADSRTLVVTDNEIPHLWTFRVSASGTLDAKDKYYGPLQIPSGKDRPGSDGMTVDTRGRLYVATHAGLQMFDPTGRLGGTIAKPQNAFLSNVCFGGPQLDTLYVTSTDKVFKRKTQAVGIRYAKK